MSTKPPLENNQGKPFNNTFRSIALYKDYRLFWSASFLEHLGEWMEITALLWVINEMTHSPFIGTLMMALRWLPMVIFAFIGGIVADRIDRRNLLAYALLASALASIAIAVLVHTSYLEVWHILAYSALTGIITSFNHPARNTLLPNLVEKKHLLNAITLDNGAIMVSRILGAPLAGIIIVLSGAMPVLGMRALGAFLAVLAIIRIPRLPSADKGKNQTPLKDFAEGIRYVDVNRPVLTQVLLYLIPIFITNTYTGLLPYLATDIMHVGPDLYGFLNAAPGAGSIIAMLLLASLASFKHKFSALLIAGLIQGAAMVLFGFLPVYMLSLILLFILGCTGTLFMILNNTMIQEMVPDHVRGRVMSFREVAFGLGPSGSLAAGAAAGIIGASLALAISGGVSVLAMLVIIAAVPHKK